MQILKRKKRLEIWKQDIKRKNNKRKNRRIITGNGLRGPQNCQLIKVRTEGRLGTQVRSDQVRLYQVLDLFHKLPNFSLTFLNCYRTQILIQPFLVVILLFLHLLFLRLMTPFHIFNLFFLLQYLHQITSFPMGSFSCLLTRPKKWKYGDMELLHQDRSDLMYGLW